MLKNKNIICISSIDWDFIWQGHQEIMSSYAKNGNRVLFIENTGARAPGIRDISRIKSRLKNWRLGISGIRQVIENLHVFSPLVLPFPYSSAARWINNKLILSTLHKWIRVMNFNDPVIWVFLPTPLSLEIIKNIPASVTIYYCIDNFQVSSSAATKIRDSEITLLEQVDTVFVTSKALSDYCLKYHKDVHFFPFAVSYEKFERQRELTPASPQELKDIPSPRVGYVGGVHKWIDLDLVRKAALRLPDYSFVFLGPVQTDISSLKGLKNVYFLGKIEHDRIPQFVYHFDACIIPYLITEYTRNVYPTKLNEYLAMGKPVVSTDLPEIQYFNKRSGNLVETACTVEEFTAVIQKSIRDDSTERQQKRIVAAKKNSWSARIEEMSLLIDTVIEKKKRIKEDWKSGFKTLYSSSKRKLKKAVLIFCAVYLICFYTPLFWLAARPLRVAQKPAAADAIVVFAGGVGESGKPGNWYQERVMQAVELYREGYARQIIFSSGYSYIYKEPRIMKGLAMTLGIPERSITLEEKAKSTHENVVFTSEIALRSNWHTLIVVSSPYHMRRVSMVYKKLFPQLRVICVPVQDSSFYRHPGERIIDGALCKWISLQQIKGIVHEYAGILVYWLKGWI